MSKYILVTGATGKQGSSVVDALLALPNASEFTILAVTRDPSSASATRLAAKSDQIKLVAGNLDDCPSLFSAAAALTSGAPLYGVYSVQISQGRGVTHEGEIRQGKAVIDEALRAGVRQLVYSSVERGGDEKSWKNATPVAHFESKYQIEHHLRNAAANSKTTGWTILRPVAFMDNLAPGFPTKVFMAAFRDTLKGKKGQWVATSDVGWFAAQAFAHPDEWKGKALGLAGDSLSYEEINDIVRGETGAELGATWWFLGSFLKYMVADLGAMINWFASEGYGADIAKLKKVHPGLLDFRTWLRERSAFETK